MFFNLERAVETFQGRPGSTRQGDKMKGKNWMMDGQEKELANASKGENHG
jgi:hypothetical protein